MLSLLICSNVVLLISQRFSHCTAHLLIGNPCLDDLVEKSGALGQMQAKLCNDAGML